MDLTERVALAGPPALIRVFWGAPTAPAADDDSLGQLANRIQARAVRRMGELLKQFDAQEKNRSTRYRCRKLS